MSDDADDRYAEPSPDHESEGDARDAETADPAPGDAAGVPVPSEDSAESSSETFRPISE